MNIAVIGGGAAGLAAAVAASKKHMVTLFEKNERVGRKILATGNGRCNLSNMAISANFRQPQVYNSPFAQDFVRLHHFEKLKRFFEGLGLELTCDETGRVYPFTEQASSVLDVLRFKCEHGGVQIQTGVCVTKIEKDSDGFFVYTVNGKQRFDRVILCAGSAAQVKDYNGLELAKGLGLRLTPCSPSLCPIKTENPPASLNGTKVKCCVRLMKSGAVEAEERGEVLFREYGLSGIAVFNLSAFIARNIVSGGSADFSLELDLFPDFSQNELCQKFAERYEQQGERFFTGLLTRVLGEEILKACGEQSVNSSNIAKICHEVKHWTHKVTGLSDYSNCQVVSGGVDVTQVRQDFSVVGCEGLYVCGECLDVDGVCGGFNLHFAFAGGIAAGANIK